LLIAISLAASIAPHRSLVALKTRVSDGQSTSIRSFQVTTESLRVIQITLPVKLLSYHKRFGPWWPARQQSDNL